MASDDLGKDSSGSLVAPYCSMIIGCIDDDSKQEGRIKTASDAIRLLRPDGATVRSGVVDSVDTKWIIYQRSKRPAWLLHDAADSIEDVLNELLVVYVRDTYVVWHATDEIVRRKILKNISISVSQPNTWGVRRVDDDRLRSRLTGDVVRGLWLHAVHSDTASRPTTKTLTGFDLSLSLRALDDGAYASSTIRSVVEGFKNAVGVNPSTS